MGPETPEAKRLRQLRELITATFAALGDFDLTASSPENARNVIRALAQRHRPYGIGSDGSVALSVEAADRVIDCLKWR